MIQDFMSQTGEYQLQGNIQQAPYLTIEID